MKLVTLCVALGLGLGCSSSEAPNVIAPPVIVFDWLRNGNRDIYRAALDGKDIVRLTSDPGDDQHPTERAGTVVFTSYRDGTLVAFASTRAGGGGGATNIYTVNVATHEIRQQTYGSVTDGQPAALPDGRIVYVSWVGGAPELRWLDPATQAVVQVSPGPGAAQHPASIY